MGDRASALWWWERAAKRGNADAMHDLEVLAYEDHDLAAARDWFQRADAHGDTGALDALKVLPNL